MALDLATVKAHVAVDHDGDDGLLTGLISSALAHLEKLTGRPLVKKELKHHLTQFPDDDYELPWPGLVEITGITYRQADDTIASVPADEYDVDASTGTDFPVLFRVPWDSPWPTAKTGNRAVTITANVGWQQENLPEDLVIAAMLLIGTWYANRENDVIGTITSKLPTGVEQITEQYRATIIG